MKYRGWACCGLVAVAFGASPALAQVTADSMSAGSQERLLDIRGEFRIDHNSNALRASPEQTALRGLTPEDTTYEPSVSVDIVQPIGRQALFLRGTAGYLFHQNNTPLDTDRFNLVGGVGANVGHCGAVASGNYFRGRGDVAQAAALDGPQSPVGIDIRNILEVTGASAQVTCSTSTGIALVLGGSYDRGDNSLPQTEVSDYRTKSATAALRYGRASSSVALTAGYTRTETPNTLFPTIGSEGYEQTTYGVQVTRRVGGRIEASGSIGYATVDLLSPAITFPTPIPVKRSSNYTTYLGTVDFRASSRLSFSAAASREVTPTLLAGSSYQISTRYNARATYHLGSRISVDVGGDQNKLTARGSALPGALTLTNSQIKGIFGSVRYQQSERLSLVLDARHERQTANIPQLEYSNDRVGLALAVSF